MSSKTTFKRVALVAVAALTLGGFSAVSASAAAGFLPTIELVSAPATATIGNPVTAIVKLSGVANSGGGDLTAQAFVAAVPGTSASPYNALTGTAYTGTAYTSTAGTLTESFNAPSYYQQEAFVPTTLPTGGATARMNAYYNLAFTPDKAGSYTIVVFSTIDTTQKATWTVVAAAPALGSSTAFLSTTTGSVATANTTSPSASGAIQTTAAAVARITVNQYSSTDTTTAMTSGYSTAVTVAISGAGTVGKLSDGTARAASATAAAAGTYNSDFYLFPDGRTGVATVTITVNGVATTKSFTFLGSLTAYGRAAADTPKTYIGVTETDVINVTGLDANSNLTASAGAIYAKSSDTTIASVSVSSQAVTIAGVAAGKATITVCDTSSCVSPTITKTFDVVITKTTVASVAIALDATSYDPGAKMTLTVTAKDADGNAIADGSRTVFTSAALTSNVSLVGTLPSTAAITFAAGKATYTVYAPVSGSNVVISGTDSLTAANALKVSATVSNASLDAANAAADAAADATDAANAATDAANNAMDSADAAQQAALDAGDKADAALAAVTDLATKVGAIAAQIVALQALVAKISASVAKIAKKVKA